MHKKISQLNLSVDIQENCGTSIDELHLLQVG
jgi:hypothetical protein